MALRQTAWLPTPGGRRVLDDRAWGRLARILRLSGRELELIHGVFDDLKEGAIAMQLGISRHTVHTHFERLYQKLGVSSRVTLVLRIFETVLVAMGDGGAVTDASPMLGMHKSSPPARASLAPP